MRQGRKLLWLLILDKTMLNSSQNSLGISRFQHIFWGYSAPFLCTAIYLSVTSSRNWDQGVHWLQSIPGQLQIFQMLKHPLEDILVCKQFFHSCIFTKESKQIAFAKASNNKTSVLRFCFT